LWERKKGRLKRLCSALPLDARGAQEGLIKVWRSGSENITEEDGVNGIFLRQKSGMQRQGQMDRKRSRGGGESGRGGSTVKEGSSLVTSGPGDKRKEVGIEGIVRERRRRNEEESRRLGGLWGQGGDRAGKKTRKGIECSNITSKERRRGKIKRFHMIEKKKSNLLAL